MRKGTNKTLRKTKKPVRKTRRGHRTERKRVRTRFIFFSFLCLFTVGTVITLSLTVFFFITDIKVLGNERYSVEEIIATSGIEVDKNLFLIDKKGAQQKILTSMPYIENVNVKRKLPSTVKIEVKETTPVCQIVVGEKAFLIDRQGKIVENTGPTPTEGITYLIGFQCEKAEVGNYLFEPDSLIKKTFGDIVDSLEKYEILPYINTINITDTFSIKLIYDTRINVIIGSGTEIDKKLSYFCEILKKINTSEKGTLDLTDPDIAPFRPSQ